MEKILIPKINDAFNTFESIIDDAYDSKLPDDILIRAYFSIIELLKKYTGAGRNVIGFSEFFYIRYVKKYLEKKLGTKFKEKSVEGGKSKFFLAAYKGKKLILSSDVSVRKAGFSERPDIFIGIQKEKEIIHPIAIFEIKLHQKNEKNINDLIERFSTMKGNIIKSFPELKDDELPYFVWLYLRYERYENQDFDKEISKFKKPDNNFIVVNNIIMWNEDDYESDIEPREGGINLILQKIVRKIENF